VRARARGARPGRDGALSLPLAREAERAAASVALALDGVPVPLDSEGRFTLGRDACGRVLVATDGAGGRSGLRLDC